MISSDRYKFWNSVTQLNVTGPSYCLFLASGECVLFAAKIKFLGSVISTEGIAPDPDKIEAVATWPTPQNLTEARAFVALEWYYRRHIRNFSLIA